MSSHNKSIQGLPIRGRPLPGAYNVRGRPSGEVPSWIQQQDDNGDSDSEHAGESAREEVIGQQQLSCVHSNEVADAWSASNNASATGDVELTEADVRYAETTITENVFVAELSSTPNDQLVIEGVKTIDPRKRRMLIFAGCSVLAAIIAYGAAMITHRIRQDDTESLRSDKTGNFLLNTSSTASDPPTLEPSVYQPTTTIVNATIAQAYSSRTTVEENPGLNNLFPDVTVIPIGSRFLDIINQTDKVFTVFGFSSSAFDQLVERSGLLLMAFQPCFSGHLLQVLESVVVEGVALSIEDMIDGTVLTTLSGFEIGIGVNGSDVRINGVPLSHVERNKQCVNGYLHNMVDFHFSFVKWLGKSNYDILLETNEKRNGDLSRFIVLVDASRDLKQRLQNGTELMTIFCFTNEALSKLDAPILVELDNVSAAGVIDSFSDIHQLLLNHVVSSIFARNVWKDFSPGKKVRDTELQLVTQAGKLISLLIEPGEQVVINGLSKMIQEDIFSEHGAVQVIDMPLLLA